MDRRNLLGALAGVGAAPFLAGCNATPGDSTTTDDPTATATQTPAVESAPTAEALDSWTFSPGGRARSRNADTNAVDVTFRPAHDGVHIEGVLTFPSSCGRPGLESVLYGDRTLRVLIAGALTANGHEAFGTPSGCDGEMVPRSYSLRVIFDDGLPDTVVVLEGASENSNRVGALEGSSEDPVRVEVDR
ncbi:hypothetical protein BRC85_07365 [Halobacteriales archaeon QS_1_69_70]|nr:MAG: hypothetical protein BRC85_07365 [Halobacteriales archaeon QS_1_69_70]